jgi:hypothetical protein
MARTSRAVKFLAGVVGGMAMIGLLWHAMTPSPRAQLHSLPTVGSRPTVGLAGTFGSHASVTAPRAAPESGGASAHPDALSPSREQDALSQPSGSRPATRINAHTVEDPSPVPINPGVDEPPMEIGEPLDADSAESQAPITDQTEPVEIGEPLDADDALTQETDLTEPSSTEIGLELDADDPDPLGFDPIDDPKAVGPTLSAEE